MEIWMYKMHFNEDQAIKCIINVASFCVDLVFLLHRLWHEN